MVKRILLKPKQKKPSADTLPDDTEAIFIKSAKKILADIDAGNAEAIDSFILDYSDVYPVIERLQADGVGIEIRHNHPLDGEWSRYGVQIFGGAWRSQIFYTYSDNDNEGLAISYLKACVFYNKRF